ncbi:efflux transporter outer membrane subunit [Mariniblastus fucicola]|uniref:Toluene efflux pump outer membrane protein TtgI n=2 Tax=Mariniblastus fucicola TaxID=980251 RepID=A0A5B9P9F6_9BACT|nr:efflux transporter outer membrane subunit [Mariniblastus fucicola]QEG22994.1 Toluene efflux pump outer membrane protein TtgI precursor [Mariniblastus fucicola]
MRPRNCTSVRISKLNLNGLSAILQAALLACILLLNGCVVGPDFSQPQPQNLQLDYLAKPHNPTIPEVDLNQWWLTFGDPMLNSLLENAQAQNLTLREAWERITEARANLMLQGGQLRPNGNLESSYEYTKNSPNSRPFVGQNGDPFNLFNLGLDASWEIDLFGKIARTIEAADAQLHFEECEFEAVRQTLFADIVSNYLRIRMLQSQMSLIEESLLIQGHTETLVTERMEAGVSTELDKSQTESFKFRTLSLLASLRQQLDLEFNQLALLMGQSPNMDLKSAIGVAPLPAMPAVPDVGFPADLLRRRPDIWRQEMAVREASARIGIAESDLYPQLTLLGTVGVSSKNISGLFETNGLEFAVGPSIEWNILNFGRIEDNIEVHRARYRQAIASYQNQALAAVKEVEDAMVNHTGYHVQWLTLQRAIEADENAVELSLERYRAGKANFQRVVDAQQQLLNDQRNHFEVQSLAITQLVRLFKAAGGDWGVSRPVLAADCECDDVFSCSELPQVVSTQPATPSTVMQFGPSPAMPMQPSPLMQNASVVMQQNPMLADPRPKLNLPPTPMPSIAHSPISRALGSSTSTAMSTAAPKSGNYPLLNGASIPVATSIFQADPRPTIANRKQSTILQVSGEQ